MKTYILLSEKRWHDMLFNQLKTRDGEEWIRINNKSDFSIAELDRIKPQKVFIPHWSYLIPSNIFDKYECIVFHMTDLPYGRGGSPLQNLILRHHESTSISAIRVEKGIDTGQVYIKRDLNINGTAEEIFLRASDIIQEMIINIIEDKPKPYPQNGDVLVFKRRKPDQSNIIELDDIKEVYNYIRMLDAEGYPKAFIETENLRFEFSRACIKADQTIIADVRISKK